MSRGKSEKKCARCGYCYPVMDNAYPYKDTIRDAYMIVKCPMCGYIERM